VKITTHLGINHQLHNLANRSTRKFNKTFLSEDITGKQGGILHYLLLRTDKGPIFQRDIESYFGIRPPSVTSILQKMEKKGYLVRKSMPDDARFKQIMLTPKALSYRESVVNGTYDYEKKLIKGISEADLEVWQRVTAQIVKNIDSDETQGGTTKW